MTKQSEISALSKLDIDLMISQISVVTARASIGQKLTKDDNQIIDKVKLLVEQMIAAEGLDDDVPVSIKLDTEIREVLVEKMRMLFASTKNGDDNSQTDGFEEMLSILELMRNGEPITSAQAETLIEDLLKLDLHFRPSKMYSKKEYTGNDYASYL